MFDWFTRKLRPMPPGTLMGLQGNETIPLPKSKEHSSAPASQPDVAYDHKNQRQLKRQQLFVVIRDVMLQAGVQSSLYKFKVLSLDSRGKQYLVMLELAWLHDGEADRLAEIENQIAKSAKSQHDLIVTAVYWRVTEPVNAGGRASPRPSAPAPLMTTATPPRPAEQSVEEEVLAFKAALAGAGATRLSAPGEIIQSGRRNPAPEPNFRDTEIDDRASPLSATQYGSL